MNDTETTTQEPEASDNHLPVFSVSVAANFFEKSSQWLRLLEDEHPTKIDGSLIKIGRIGTSVGQRRYTLQNIADLAEWLLRVKKITKLEFESVMRRVHAWF